MVKKYAIKFLLIQVCFLGIFSFQAIAQDIFEVARNGTASEVEAVYKRTPDQINTKNEAGFSPLILAAYHENFEVAQALLKYVSSVDESSSSGTALMAATVKGNAEIVSLLLDHKADPNGTDGNGSTALIYAVFFKNDDIVALLLAHRVDVSYKDSKGYTALDYAEITKNESLINLIKNHE